MALKMRWLVANIREFVDMRFTGQRTSGMAVCVRNGKIQSDINDDNSVTKAVGMCKRYVNGTHK